ncbi:hypothetical protein [Faecalimicrobium sp. JNUCC 81]
MLNNYSISMASIIANDLLQEGMIWGDDLEWYIKVSLEGSIKFKNDKEYLEFENKVLEFIETRTNNTIKVTDLHKQSSKIYFKISDVAKYLKKSDTCIYKSLKNKNLISQRYKIEMIKPRLEDISYNLSTTLYYKGY